MRGYLHGVIEVGSPTLYGLQHYLDEDPIMYKKRKAKRTRAWICLLLDNGCEVASHIELSSSPRCLDFPAVITGPLNHETEEALSSLT